MKVEEGEVEFLFEVMSCCDITDISLRETGNYRLLISPACAQRTGSFYVSGPQSPQGLVSLLHYWVKSYLQLLGDFGPGLKDSPQEVHRVDLERVFKPSDFQILESIRSSGSYHRHYLLMMRNFAEFLPSMLLIEPCEKSTSGTELDGYFVVDEMPKSILHAEPRFHYSASYLLLGGSLGVNGSLLLLIPNLKKATSVSEQKELR